jgi:hypothetical protein
MRQKYILTTAFLFFSITWISAQTLDVNFTGINGNCYANVGLSETQTLGQSFTATISGNLTTVKVGIATDACTETTTMNCVATLYNGTCAGAVLTTENFSIPTGSSLSMYPINFSNPASIFSGQTYTLGLSVVSGQNCALNPMSMPGMPGMSAFNPVRGRWFVENAGDCGGEYAGGTAYVSGCVVFPYDFYIQTYVSQLQAVLGCTDVTACNYNASATVLNGSCTYASTWYLDVDGDGYYVSTSVSCTSPGANYNASGGINGDCNDNNALVNAGITEICNSIDDDCDTQIDEGVQNTYYADIDGDGYGAPASSVQACTLPLGYVVNNLDCNDVNSAISPITIWYLDVDGDGYYVSTSVSCTSPGATYTTTGGIVGDCNDSNPLVRPGVTEICNVIDDDCDGMIDENASNTY